MSRTYKDSPHRKGRERHISVRAVRRNPPDARKLSRAAIQMAMEEAAAEAASQTEEIEQIDNAAEATEEHRD
jgi:hypothetical protein